MTLTPDPAISLPTLQLQILAYLTLTKDMYVCLKIEYLNIITERISKNLTKTQVKKLKSKRTNQLEDEILSTLKLEIVTH